MTVSLYKLPEQSAVRDVIYKNCLLQREVFSCKGKQPFRPSVMFLLKCSYTLSDIFPTQEKYVPCRELAYTHISEPDSGKN